MIKCPSCGCENIEGADHCQDCEADLFDIGLPHTSLPDLGQRLIQESILKLKPLLRVKVVPENTLAQVVQVMCDEKASAVMVVHQDTLVGLFTERDFLLKIADRYEIFANEPVRKFMTPSPECLEASDSIAFGLNRMAVGNYRHIPILEQGRPEVVVRTRDVLNYISDHCQRAFGSTAG